MAGLQQAFEGRLAADTELGLLGGFRLECRDGSPVPLASQRLLALLALQNGPVSRTFVAGTLWPNSSDRKATASLRSALWRLRQCHPDLVATQHATLSVGGGVWVDVHELTTQSLAFLNETALPDADVFDLLVFAHELLPDWYDDWVLVERERLRQLRLHALEEIAHRYIEAGDHASAVRAAAAAVSDEPLRESAHRVLIAAHIGGGNYVEAVRQYDLFATLLRNELGLSPSPHMAALMQSLTPT